MPTNLAIDDRLIQQAQKLGRHRTKKDAVTAALDEYIQRRKQQDILPLFGTIDYQANYHYKSERRRKRRSTFGKLLNRVDKESRSLVIEKRGTPRAILLSIRDYVRLAAPEPEVLRAIGEESRRKGTASLSSRQIDRIIKAVRAQEKIGRERRAKD